MLDTISEGRIMDVLKTRYGQDLIYTNIGPVLIAINPFKLIASMYTEARIREYRGKKFFEMPPHVYSLADETYSNMISFRENQCVIISGESGSGKTETSKIIMQYISSVSGRSAEVQRVKERMLSSNPVLEAFGNAKTVNNNNSSRFGKYMQILFDYGGDPVGGRVTNCTDMDARTLPPALLHDPSAAVLVTSAITPHTGTDPLVPLSCDRSAGEVACGGPRQRRAQFPHILSVLCGSI
jgi:myosin I